MAKSAEDIEKGFQALGLTPEQIIGVEALLSQRKDFPGLFEDDPGYGVGYVERLALLQAVWDTAVDGIVTIDEKGIIQSFNPAAERIFDYSASEVVGQKVNMLMPSPFRERHDTYIRNYLDTGKANIIGVGREVIGVKKDKTTFPVYLAVSQVNVANRIWFAGIVRDITRRRNSEEAIVSTGEQVRQLIGQDLHDVLGQQLAGIALLTKTLERKLESAEEGTRTLAEQISELARTTMGEAKRLAQGLYPTALEKHGLNAALEELAETMNLLHGLNFAYFEDIEDEFALSKSTELHLYRIAQEATSNVVKHARAKNGEIHLTRTPKNLTLIIEDDGVGIPAASSKIEGMGLQTMKHRASMIGASVEVRRRETNGTVVRCVLPVYT